MNTKSKHKNKPNITKFANWYISNTRINRVSKLMWPEYKHIIKFDEFKELFICCSTVYNNLLENRGTIQGTKRFLQIRRNSIKLSFGLSVEPIPCMATYATGYPRCIKPLIKWLSSGNFDHKRLAIAALNVSKLSSVGNFPLTKASLSSIVRNINRDESFYEDLRLFQKNLPKALKDLGIECNVAPSTIVDLASNSTENKHNLVGIFKDSIKKGPNSKFIKGVNLPKYHENDNNNRSALMAAPLDAFAIVNDKKLSLTFSKICKILHIDELWSYIQKLSETITKNKGYCTSRLTIVNQPDNKGRIIAMGDYFSQIVLYQIEQYLIKYVESKIDCSFAMDQNSGIERVQKFTLSGNPYSLDGTAFTDRFPKELQREVLKVIFNEEFANVVIDLMVKRDFYVNDNYSVRYEVGQPMGLHCSFHLANITHCLVAICCQDYSNIKSRTEQLAVCGDDIVINGQSLSKSYLRFMKNMKMDFNPSKGFDSDISSNIRIAEFCKSIFVNGILVSNHTLRVSDKLSKDIYYIQQYVKYSKYDFTNVILTILLGTPKIKMRWRANETIVLLCLIYSNGVLSKYDKHIIRLHLQFCSENFQRTIDDLLSENLTNQFIRIRYAIIYSLYEMKERELASSLDSYDMKMLENLALEYRMSSGSPTWVLITNGNIKQPFELAFKKQFLKGDKFVNLTDISGFTSDSNFRANKNALKSSLFTGGLTSARSLLDHLADSDQESLNKILFRLTLSFINITNSLYDSDYNSSKQLLLTINLRIKSDFRSLKNKFKKKKKPKVNKNPAPIGGGIIIDMDF